MGIYTGVGILAIVLTGLHAHADATGVRAPRLRIGANAAKNRTESPENA
jgi:hypothetical protein